MGRHAILSSLIKFDAPVADLTAALATLSWDAEPVVTLTRQHIAAVLERFARRDIGADALEEWANLVECREDIGFEAGHEDVVAGAIHDLANPELSGPLVVTAPRVLSV